jgi:Family of unknown function (DUF6463)
MTTRAPRSRMSGARARRPPASLTPSSAVKVIAAGHLAWGGLAYRRELAELVGAPLDSVGDGICSRDHSADGRAAAFWFVLAAPLIWLAGRLIGSAEPAGDTEALKAAGTTVLGIGTVGTVVMPRSGFPIVAPVGLWLLARSRRRR